MHTVSFSPVRFQRTNLAACGESICPRFAPPLGKTELGLLTTINRMTISNINTYDMNGAKLKASRLQTKSWANLTNINNSSGLQNSTNRHENPVNQRFVN